MEKKHHLNPNSAIDQYAMNLKIKIRHSVIKKRNNNSPRLNNDNLNLIEYDPQ